nr:MAG TPA: hypothetical protein [Caudoviricetes sp.]
MAHDCAGTKVLGGRAPFYIFREEGQMWEM